MRYWRHVCANNAIEHLNCEVRCQVQVAGMFPADRSALMLVTARLKYVAESEWGGSRGDLEVSLLDA